MAMISPSALSMMVGLSVGGAAAYLGSLMISRRMALTGDALGHVALPGMGVALLYHWDVSLGAFAALLAGVLLVWRWEKKTTLSAETLVGIVFVASLALGFLIVPQPELLESLVGDISKVSIKSGCASVLLALGVIWGIRRIYAGLILSSLSSDLAAVQGIPVRRYELLYFLAIAVIVALGVKVTGSLLVGALVIVPAAVARNLSRNMAQYAYGSLLIGMATCGIGILGSRFTGFPAGPMIILVNVALFAASFLLKRNS